MQMKGVVARLFIFLAVVVVVSAASLAQSDVIKTSKGDLRITPITHASLMLEFDGKVIYVDPVNTGDYTGKPKADLILLTHAHPDHVNRARIDDLENPKTIVVGPEGVAVSRLISEARVLGNGETKTFAGIEIEAVPMYNQTEGPEPGKFYHSKGSGNGYVLTLGGKRLYVSGDTECIPDIKALKNIDIAFICMNAPYTMSPPQAAECVNSFRPKIVYPYDYGLNNLEEFSNAMKGTAGVEVRLRTWYSPSTGFPEPVSTQ